MDCHYVNVSKQCTLRKSFHGPILKGYNGILQYERIFFINTSGLILRIIKPQTFTENLLFSWHCAILSAWRNIRVYETIRAFPQEAHSLGEKVRSSSLNEVDSSTWSSETKV